jgi:hypothetical protein
MSVETTPACHATPAPARASARPEKCCPNAACSCPIDAVSSMTNRRSTAGNAAWRKSSSTTTSVDASPVSVGSREKSLHPAHTAARHAQRMLVTYPERSFSPFGYAVKGAARNWSRTDVV